LIVKIKLMNDEVRFTEASNLNDVADKLMKGQVVKCFWHHTPTGDRWEEEIVFLEGARYIEEETNDCVKEGRPNARPS